MFLVNIGSNQQSKQSGREKETISSTIVLGSIMIITINCTSTTSDQLLWETFATRDLRKQAVTVITAPKRSSTFEKRQSTNWFIQGSWSTNACRGNGFAVKPGSSHKRKRAREKTEETLVRFHDGGILRGQRESVHIVVVTPVVAVPIWAVALVVGVGVRRGWWGWVELVLRAERRLVIGVVLFNIGGDVNITGIGEDVNIAAIGHIGVLVLAE